MAKQIDTKLRAAEIVMAFLPIVGQDVHTGLRTAKECAIAAVKIAQQDRDALRCEKIHGEYCVYRQLIKDIESF